MRKLWLRSLALSLGLVVTGARGQEGVWRAPQSPGASNSPPAAVALGKPIAIASSRPGEPVASTTAATSPAASLGRPVAIATSKTVQDANLTQVSFTPRRDPRAPIARGAAPDNVPARPMPMGPNGGSVIMPSPGMHTWRTGEGVVASTVSRNQADPLAAPPPSVGGGTLVAPTPLPSGPMGPGLSPAPMPSPGIISSPGTIISQPGPALPGGIASPGIVNGPGISTGPGIVSGPGIVTGPGVVTTPGSPFPPPTIVSGPGMLSSDNCCAPSGIGYGSAGCCATGGCNPWGGGGCCPGEPRFVIGAEALLWWLPGDKTPPLVIQGAAASTPAGFVDSMNNGTTLYGNARNADNARPGGRLYGQYWFSDDHCWGLDASGFALGNADDGAFMVYGNGSETSLGRPFVINPAIPNGGGVEEVAGPFLNGSVSIGRQSNLWGADFNIRKNVCCSDWFRLDVLAGARVLGLDENLSITENLTVYAVPPGSGLAVNNQFTVNDRFTTVNRFYGAQVGVDGEMRYGPFSLGMRAKLAVGSSQQQVQIAGSTVLTQGTNRSVLVNSTGNTGGLLAQAGTNIGSYTRTMFGIVPEVGFTLGYDVFDWWRLTAGYNVLYWNSVARPGEQIDLRVNPAYLPAGRPQPFTGGATSDARLPAFDMKSSDMLIHGITLGMEFRY